jgi:hypothetical protein
VEWDHAFPLLFIVGYSLSRWIASRSQTGTPQTGPIRSVPNVTADPERWICPDRREIATALGISTDEETRLYDERPSPTAEARAHPLWDDQLDW